MPDGTNDNASDGAPVNSDDAAGKLKELQDKIAALELQRDEFKGKFESSIESRKKAKQAEADEAAKRGEYEAALKIRDERIAELEGLKTEVESLKGIKEQHEKLVNEQRLELIACLPDGSREEYKDTTLDELRRAVKLLPEEKRPGTHKGAARSTSISTDDIPWDKLSFEQQAEYTTTHSKAERIARIQGKK